MITASEAMNLAILSYREKLIAISDAVRKGYRDVDYFDRRDVQCLCVSRDNDVIIAFRGTDPHRLLDWIRNLDGRKSENPSGPGKVHAGLFRELERVWPDLVTYLDRHKGQVIHFVGHSKGGGLATQAALRRSYVDHGTLMHVWSFGAPRCLTRAAAIEIEERRNIRINRFVIAGDPVPWLPRWWWGFRHAGGSKYFEGGLLIDNPNYVEQWIDGVEAYFAYFCRRVRQIKERHSTIVYRQAVEGHYGEAA